MTLDGIHLVVGPTISASLSAMLANEMTLIARSVWGVVGEDRRE